MDDIGTQGNPDTEETPANSWDTASADTHWAAYHQLDEDNPDGEVLWRLTRDADAAEDELTRALESTLKRLGSLAEPLSRIERVRLLLRRRPTAAALLAFLLVGMLLTCCAPLVPVLRLGTDAADAYRRVQALQSLFSGGSSSLLNSAKLQEAQGQLDGLSQDMAEINSVVNVIGAPLGVVSPQIRDYRLLAHIGNDLVAAADEGVQVAQTLLTPLEGALSASDSSPGITQADVQQAQQVMRDAQSRVADALVAYGQLDQRTLPAQLQPGSKLGKYLALLPSAPQVLGELQTLLGSVPALLGIGQPANYLVLALDRSELRPIGGFAGNYGILTLAGGRQSTQYPLTLNNVYLLDSEYFHTIVANSGNTNTCYVAGTQPPEYYWWWPYRYLSCQYAWGLRDVGLSPDFPINAQAAINIVQATAGALPPTTNPQLQGVIAFTPILIEQLLQLTGPISLPQWDNVTVTPQNLEYLIHVYQLVKAPQGTDRKAFTHDLSAVMLTKLKSLHGSQLKAVFDVAAKALKSKDLQLYFADPHAELILQQLGLASTVRTGNGDGFYVVDTNDGGDKANAYVTEQQTDVVTLLPNGGALHHLRIFVTYNRTGQVFGDKIDDYNDMQRIYLPGDATVLGYSGFNPLAYSGVGITCGSVSSKNAFVSTIATDCGNDGGIHAFTTPVTASDVPGRAMVMGAVTLNCGPSANLLATNTYDDSYACQHGSTPHTQTIYVEYYTPHAFTLGSSGHGTYSEVVEEQPGSGDFIFNIGNYLTVYMDTSQLHASQPQTGPLSISDDPTYQQLIGHLQPLAGFSAVPLDSDKTITVSF